MENSRLLFSFANDVSASFKVTFQRQRGLKVEANFFMLKLSSSAHSAELETEEPSFNPLLFQFRVDDLHEG